MHRCWPATRPMALWSGFPLVCSFFPGPKPPIDGHLLTRLHTVQNMQQRLDFYSHRNEQLVQDHTKQQLQSSLNSIDSLNGQILSLSSQVAQKDELNRELMDLIGELKLSVQTIKEAGLLLERKVAQQKEEMAMSKKALEMAHDHILELEMENNMMTLNHS